MHSLPVFLRLARRPVILIGDGDAATAKRRLLERAGAMVVGEDAVAAFAIVAIDDDAQAEATVARLRARGILVNATDRSALCDFTLPAIIDRDPVLIAIGTGGASAGLAAALRQRLEALFPPRLGDLATALDAARSAIRRRWPDAAARRRAIASALAEGGALDPLGSGPRDIPGWLSGSDADAPRRVITIHLRSPDPDELTLREARLLATADRVHHSAGVPIAILDRARADAPRVPSAPQGVPDGLWIDLRLE
ncbi:MAG: siroheme synthase [Sphingomonadaceae bacterium]|nr:siroheme synthase [Sphingomonadaceae bacterium]